MGKTKGAKPAKTAKPAKKTESEKSATRKARAEARSARAGLKKSKRLIAVLSVSLAVILVGVGVMSYFLWFKKAPTEINQARYEVVPSSDLLNSTKKSVAPTSGFVRTAAGDDETSKEDPVVKYSATDNTNNYYLLYLGYVKNTPVASNLAVWYDGKTPISVSFSKSTVTETSVQQSVETCVSESVTKSNSVASSVKVGVSFKAGSLFTSASTSIEAGVEHTDRKSVV